MREYLFLAFFTTVTFRAFTQPDIISVFPDTIYAGNQLTLTGNTFNTITAIKLGTRDLDIASIQYIASGIIAFDLPLNITQGLYYLQLYEGTVSGTSFPLTISGPRIISLDTGQQEIDHTVIISTAKVDTILAVYFGNLSADLNSIVRINGQNTISILVPYTNSLGNYPITIHTRYDITPPYPFSISGLNIPEIISILPAEANVNDIITVNGNHFNSLTGITFGSVLADSQTIIPIDENTFTVQVPFITPGNNQAKVYTKRGQSEYFSFALAATSPAITDFFPKSTKIGDAVTLVGQYLSSATLIELGTFSIPGINLIDQGTISFIVPNGATSSAIKVTTPFGNYTTSEILAIDTITSIRSATLPFFDNIISVSFSDNYIEINARSIIESIRIMDLSGRTIYKSQPFVDQTRLNKNDLKGYLIVEIITTNGVKKLKLFSAY